MHQSRALTATAQDVCVFCAFRATSRSRASIAQRRSLSATPSSRRQNVGFAFKQEFEDSGFGGLADEVAKATPAPPPPPPPASNRRQPDPQPLHPAIRFQRVGRGENGLGGQNYLQQERRREERASAAGPRFRRVSNIHGSVQSPEADVNATTAARWNIGRHSQGNQQRGGTSAYSPPAPQQQQTFERAPAANARSPFSNSPSGEAWSQTSGGNAAYVPFDARFNSANSEPRSQQSRLTPSHNRPAGESVSTRQRTVGEQLNSRMPREDQPRYNNDSGPRISQLANAYNRTARPARDRPSRQQFDEYGFPIESEAASTSTTASQYLPSYEPTRRNDRDTRIRTKTKFGRDEREDEREGRRGDRKGKSSSRKEERERDDDFDVEDYHRKKRERQAAKVVARDVSKIKADRRTIRLPDFIRVGSLATELQLRYGRFAQILSKYGFEDVNSDFVLTAENAALIVEEAGFIAVTESKEADEDLYAAALPEDMSVFPQRPPVVTIMGHVDHGKTTILDHMRKSSIVASEHGGITQHIGAFSVPMPSGKTITFLDTPGHAAFLSMRQRGANVTDIVILVVAADDSVMPQTLEALKHAKAAQVPIIVAMNKIDKPEAKPDQVKQDLARHGVDIEDYGGDVQVVLVSGKTGQGMQDLEEAIVALSEIQDQRAPVDGNVEGWVLESSTKEVGKVATVLVRRGTLHAGDIVVAGTEYCRVRSMRDEFGNQVSEVGPGMPAEIDGWRGQPNAGDEVLQAPNEQVAGNVTSLREAKLKRVDLAKDVEVINEQRKARQIEHEREKAIERARKEGVELPDDVAETATDNGTGIKNVYLIIKGDVAGSVEAVVNSIAPLGNSEVRPIILKAAVGTVSESDVDHATASGGQVISFNTTISPNIRALAERAGTKILDHNIIYRLVDDVKASLEAELTPIVKSRVLGEAEIAQIFEINQKRKKVKIAGCKVRNGTVVRNSKVRVLRGLENEVVYAGSFSSLKNVKKDVMEMAKGTECGMSFGDEWQDFQPGDVAQCYEEWEEKRKL